MKRFSMQMSCNCVKKQANGPIEYRTVSERHLETAEIAAFTSRTVDLL